MYLSSEKKQDLFKTHGTVKKATDTGSSESQIALFTYRIAHLTEHLKNNKQDHACRLGLLKLVGKRRRFLDYLKDSDIERYRAVLTDLNLRK